MTKDTSTNPELESHLHGQGETVAAGVSDERLAEMLAGLEGVSPSPWHVQHDDEVWNEGYFVSGGGNHIPDAAHIARCDPDTIRSLVLEVQSLRARLSSIDTAGPAGVEPVAWPRIRSWTGSYGSDKGNEIPLAMARCLDTYADIKPAEGRLLWSMRAAAQWMRDVVALGPLYTAPSPIGGEAEPVAVTDMMVADAMTAFVSSVRGQDPEWTDDSDEGEVLLTAPNGDFFALECPLRDALIAALARQGGVK